MDQSFREILSDLPFKTLVLDEGKFLFRQGQKTKAIFLVESGMVRLQRHLKDGAVAVMHLAREGEWVAEASLFSDRYHCHAVAIGKTRLRVLDRQSVRSLLADKPKLCLALAQEMALRLRDLRASHETLRIRRAPDRLLAWMQIHSRGTPPTLVVDRPWTRIAEELAMSREALYRALASLQHTGAIRVADRTVVLRSLGMRSAQPE